MARLAGAMRLEAGPVKLDASKPPLQLRLSEAMLAALLAAPRKDALQFDPGNGTADVPPALVLGDNVLCCFDTTKESMPHDLYVGEAGSTLRYVGKVKQKLNIRLGEGDLEGATARLRARTAAAESERQSRTTIALDADNKPTTNGHASSVARRAISPAPSRPRSPAPTAPSPRPFQPSKLGPGALPPPKPACAAPVQSASTATSPASSSSTTSESVTTPSAPAAVALPALKVTAPSAKRPSPTDLPPATAAKRAKASPSPPALLAPKPAPARRRPSGSSTSDSEPLSANGPRPVAKTAGGARISRPIKRTSAVAKPARDTPAVKAESVEPAASTSAAKARPVEKRKASGSAAVDVKPKVEADEPRPRKKARKQPDMRHRDFTSSEDEADGPPANGVQRLGSSASPAGTKVKTPLSSPDFGARALPAAITSAAEYATARANYEKMHTSFDAMRRNLLDQRAAIVKALEAAKRKGGPAPGLVKGADPTSLNAECRQLRYMREDLVTTKAALQAYVASRK